MKKLCSAVLSLLVLLLFLSPVAVAAQDITEQDALKVYIQKEFDKTHFPGMSVEIVDANAVLLAEVYGNCTSLDAPFIIGSLSKSFTAAAVLQLVEVGQINLADPIAKYLPDADQNSKTTVKQLLNQTSGIKTYQTLENYKTSDTPAPYQYANVNYGLLGQIVENISGMEYSAYIQKYIFSPLHMAHSFASPEEAQANGLVDGYRNYLGLMVKQSTAFPQNNYSGWITAPAGYIAASTNDMGRYLQMYLNNGADVLAKSSVETMMFDSVDVAENYEYGMGLGLDYRSGELMVVHGGNVENYTTYMIIMPQRGIAAIAMFNACDFFVANEMAIQLTYNIVNKYLGLPTGNIGPSAYFTSHALIDAAVLAAVVLCVLPLLLAKRWAAKHKGKLKKASVVFAVLLHMALPTFLLLLAPALGVPMFVVRRFVPDVFITILVCSALLYLGGIIKLVCIARGKAAQ